MSRYLPIPIPHLNHRYESQQKSRHRRELNGYLRAKVMKIIGKSYHFRLFFSRNIKVLLCEGTQTTTKALYLFYFEQIIQHHLVLDVLPTSIMLYTIRSYHRKMEGLLRSCRLLKQFPALD